MSRGHIAEAMVTTKVTPRCTHHIDFLRRAAPVILNHLELELKSGLLARTSNRTDDPTLTAPQ